MSNEPNEPPLDHLHLFYRAFRVFQDMENRRRIDRELRLEALLALARESELGEDEAPVKEIAVNRLSAPGIPSSLRVDNPIPAAKPVKGLEDLWVVRTLEYRVWFDDVDINLHMTGISYTKFMDYCRLDFLLAVFHHTHRSASTPSTSIAESQVNLYFKRNLRLFDVFRIETRLITYDEKNMYLEHRFLTKGRRRRIDDEKRGRSKRRRSVPPGGMKTWDARMERNQSPAPSPSQNSSSNSPVVDPSRPTRFLEWSGFGIPPPPPPPDMYEESGTWSMERILEAKREREERRRRGVKVVEALARAEDAVMEMGI
ncbi:hypothetical protein BC829DRAFT_448301 [Chytridium lagenaria]|nr:hypothetical protein BC829DRAFT_448301 [Chytridium lagenaria]